MVDKAAVLAQLKKVIDPELGINIVDLGLIYGIQVKKDTVAILLTLTFPGCPLGGAITEEVKEEVKSLEGVRAVEVNLTFDPPWDISKISDEANINLGFSRFSEDRIIE